LGSTGELSSFVDTYKYKENAGTTRIRHDEVFYSNLPHVARGLAIEYQTMPNPTSPSTVNSTFIQLNVLTPSSSDGLSFASLMNSATPQVTDMILNSVKSALLAANFTDAANFLSMNVTGAKMTTLVYRKSWWGLFLDFLYRNMVNVFLGVGFLFFFMCLLMFWRWLAKRRRRRYVAAKTAIMADKLKAIRDPILEARQRQETSILLVKKAEECFEEGASAARGVEETRRNLAKTETGDTSKEKRGEEGTMDNPTINLNDIANKFGVRSSSILPASLRYKAGSLEAGAKVAQVAINRVFKGSPTGTRHSSQLPRYQNGDNREPLNPTISRNKRSNGSPLRAIGVRVLSDVNAPPSPRPDYPANSTEFNEEMLPGQATSTNPRDSPTLSLDSRTSSLDPPPPLTGTLPRGHPAVGPSPSSIPSPQSYSTRSRFSRLVGKASLSLANQANDLPSASFQGVEDFGEALDANQPSILFPVPQSELDV